MLLAQDEFYEVISSIWQTVLGLEISPRPDMHLPPRREEYLTGCVQLSGSWNGAIILICSGLLARQAAGVVFSVEEGEVTTELLHDVIGELTNMLAGNLKALLPGACALSLPVVADGADHALRVLACRRVLEMGLSCGELPLGVMVLERDPERAGSAQARAQQTRIREEFA